MLLCKLLLVIILMIFQSFAVQNFSDFINYCELNCHIWPNIIHKHIVCERSKHKCGPDASCTNYRKYPMNDELRQALLDKHNELRNRVALGQEKRGPQPSAANMNALNYHEELEFIAQCLANTCTFKHDKCRRTRTIQAGQNIAYYYHSIPKFLTEKHSILFLIEGFYNEVSIFNPEDIHSFAFDNKTGHYTEMIWAEIEYIGCAGAIYQKNNFDTLLLVCNYGGGRTSGNFERASIYEIGKPCSKCPNDRVCNTKYEGLCGQDVPVQIRNEAYINQNVVKTEEPEDYDYNYEFFDFVFL